MLRTLASQAPGIDAASTARPVYTPDERLRRDATRWTLVQGVLAPLQFVVFLVSLVLITRYLSTGEGAQLALISVLVKTAVLLLIMITGAIWEKVVFGQFLFAPSFFWEDVFSMLVIALHLAVVAAWWHGEAWLDVPAQMTLALAAYAAYAINAAQFLWKLRRARLERPKPADAPMRTDHAHRAAGTGLAS
jgi:3-vinyl bacteriochlorophyllide hydratase